MQLLRELVAHTLAETKLNGFTIMTVKKFLSEAPIGKYRTLGDDKMQLHLKNVKDKTTDRSRARQMPIMHASNLKVVGEDGEQIDTEALKKDITTRPKTMLQKNKKMQHSEGDEADYYNIGLPALRGLAVNEETGEFIVVNTCPSAGTCMMDCYALKGGYVQYPGSSMFRSRMINYLVNDPEGFKAQLIAEIGAKVKTSKRTGKQVAVRWHDAGDFFSPEYLQIANDIANEFPEVQFYAYTKNSEVMGNTPENFDTRFSDGASKSDLAAVDFEKHRSGRIVPKELSDDLKTGGHDADGRWEFKPGGIEELKRRVAKKYGVNAKSILTDKEYVDSQASLGDKENSWNVIVIPGGSDAPANDRRVLNVFNLYHE
jgi:hypothetical protein